MMTAYISPSASPARAGAEPPGDCAGPSISASAASNSALAALSLVRHASSCAAAQLSQARHRSTATPPASGCAECGRPVAPALLALISAGATTAISRGAAAGKLQHVRHTDQARALAQRVRGAVPGAGDPALHAGAPQAGEQLEYRRIDLFDLGTVDDDGFALLEARQQRAMQTGGLRDGQPDVEFDVRRPCRTLGFGGARRLLRAHAAATPGRSSSAMLLPMSRSMSSRISIFSSMVASAFTNTVSTLPHTSGGGLVSAASTL